MRYVAAITAYSRSIYNSYHVHNTDIRLLWVGFYLSNDIDFTDLILYQSRYQQVILMYYMKNLGRTINTMRSASHQNDIQKEKCQQQQKDTIRSHAQ